MALAELLRPRRHVQVIASAGDGTLPEPRLELSRVEQGFPEIDLPRLAEVIEDRSVPMTDVEAFDDLRREVFEGHHHGTVSYSIRWGVTKGEASKRLAAWEDAGFIYRRRQGKFMYVTRVVGELLGIEQAAHFVRYMQREDMEGPHLEKHVLHAYRDWAKRAGLPVLSDEAMRPLLARAHCKYMEPPAYWRDRSSIWISIPSAEELEVSQPEPPVSEAVAA